MAYSGTLTTSSGGTVACKWYLSPSLYSGASTTTANTSSSKYWEVDDYMVMQDSEIRKGRDYDLPDGAKLIVDANGNYRIDDKDAKVTYKANRIREFSPHLNASDMLAEFVKYVRKVGVDSQDVMRLPLHLFVSWLIIEAAQRDGDAIPENVLPVQADPMVRLLVRPRCLLCGKFIPRLHQRNQFPFCSPVHGAAHVAKLSDGRQLVPVNNGTL